MIFFSAAGRSAAPSRRKAKPTSALFEKVFMTLTKHQVGGQSSLAGLFVFCAHVLAGIGEGLDSRVQIDAVTRLNFVGRNHERNPGLHRAKSAALDAGHL